MDRGKDLKPLISLLEGLRPIAPVGAVGGNHDRRVGLERVRDAVLSNGGRWLEDQPWRWNQNLVVYGRSEQKRQPARCHVLCTHDPAGIDKASRRGMDLVLAGHIHGGQVALFLWDGRWYPGAFLYRWNGPRFEQNGTTLLVSRGLTDFIPIRWNCPREILLAEI